MCLNLAMQTAHGNLHLEIQTTRKSPVGILRTSFRDHGKMRHTQHGRITGCSLEQLKLLQMAFRERVVPIDDPQAFRILYSRELGASQAILAIAKQLGLHRLLYSRAEPWVSSALAMIEPGPKCRAWPQMSQMSAQMSALAPWLPFSA